MMQPTVLADGSVITVEEKWSRLWDGTYFDYVPEDAPNVRSYQPYVIKLKVVNPLDLELIAEDSPNKNSAGACDAIYQDGYVYVKAVGNTIELANSQKGIKETIKLTISNDVNPDTNTI